MSAGSRAINSWASATLLFSLALTACDAPGDDDPEMDDNETTMRALVDQYAVFRLEADLSHLSENDRQVVRLLIEAAQPMEDAFWQQAYGDREEALALAQGDEATPPVHRDQLRALGPAPGRRSIHRGRRNQAGGRQLLPRRHDRGGIRGCRRRQRSPPLPLHPRAPGPGRLAGRPALSPGLRGRTRGRRGEAAGSVSPGERSRAGHVSPVACRRPRVRRLPAERHGLARHEGEPDRRRDRTDRDV